MHLLFLFLIGFNYLLANEVDYYFFSVKENYKEYEDGKVIDRDYSSFGELNGVGLKYDNNRHKIGFYFMSEGVFGTSTYDGSYWDGTPVSFKQYNVMIYNFRAGIYRKYPFLEVGYRFWNRGNSTYSYEEHYYWPYVSSGIKYFYNYKQYKFNFFVKYNYAIDPKLKVYLGNQPTLNLGKTTGIDTELSIYRQINSKYRLGIFYRFSYWHINKSKPALLELDEGIISIYEPESKTRNQYIGIYIQRSF